MLGEWVVAFGWWRCEPRKSGAAWRRRRHIVSDNIEGTSPGGRYIAREVPWGMPGRVSHLWTSCRSEPPGRGKTCRCNNSWRSCT